MLLDTSRFETRRPRHPGLLRYEREKGIPFVSLGSDVHAPLTHPCSVRLSSDLLSSSLSSLVSPSPPCPSPRVTGSQLMHVFSLQPPISVSSERGITHSEGRRSSSNNGDALAPR